MSKKPFNAATVFIILGLLFIAAIGLRTISTPEIWSHLAQGKGTIAPLSFLESDTAVNSTVLYDKLAYILWNAGGAPLLIILNIIGLIGTFGLLLPVAKKWGGELSQGFALLIVGHLMFQSVDVGPQTVMMLAIAAFIHLLSTAKNPALLFGILIPTQILWTNMHGSFLFGPILAVLAGFQAEQAGKITGRKRKSDIQPGTFFILAVALAVSTLANPYFFKMHLQAIANIQNSAPAYWSSLFLEYFQVPPLKPLILLALVLGACGLITLKKRLPLMLTSLAIFGAFLLWTSPRASQLFSVLAFPFLVLSLTSVSEYVRGSLSHLLGKQTELLFPATGAIFVILIVLSISHIASNYAFIKTASASHFGFGVQEELYPSDAETIINHPAFPEKTLNMAADGGYLAFNYDRPIFIDYRAGRYDRELLKNLNLMMSGDSQAYDDIYETYRPEAIIINTLYSASARGLYVLLARRTPEGNPIWKLVYFDGTTAILLLDKEKFEPLLNNTEAQNAGLAKLEAARAAYAEKVEKGKLAGNPAELVGSGKIFLAFNRLKESKAIFSLLLQGNGNIPAAWLGLGSSQLRLMEFEDAAASLKVATKLMPNNFNAWNDYAVACKQLGQTEQYEKAVKKIEQLKEQLQAEEAEAEEPEVKLPETSITNDKALDEFLVPEKL